MAECCDGCINTNPANGCSVEEGNGTTASGFASHAEGSNTTASGFASHAEGSQTQANFGTSHTEGFQTQTNEAVAHAEGFQSTASAYASHAEGYDTQANGAASHAEGGNTIASGLYSHAEGSATLASGDFSHAEGQLNTATGRSSHAEGGGVDLGGNPAPNQANGIASHAEGLDTIANGLASHAEGGTDNIIFARGPRANGNFSHAEGTETIASGNASHAEGRSTRALGFASHAEGQLTQALSNEAHAEGLGTIAGGRAHAQGTNTQALALQSHAEGINTIVRVQDTNSHIMGSNGTTNDANSWFLANGGLRAKINGITGNACFAGAVTGGGVACDFAEMFETVDCNSIDVGYFVTLEGRKIRIATEKDDYILGITSATPFILAGTAELDWQDRFVTDEWGRIQYEEVVIPAEKDQQGIVMIPERTETQRIPNPKWNPDKEYIPRAQRSEWTAVGLVGQVRVRDDGTCKINGYCMPNGEGIATSSDHGYRVMERTGVNQVLVLLNSQPLTNELDPVVKLEKLANLKEQGYLTEEEFQIQKQKLLNS
ncbi:hypothetical protein OJ967_09385 [Peribacillus frigoritolerans]|uniref:peptidase G2 autoproteolytic cleavage domain-containing protein n=1 Tax=Peribacillus frigoritolerans TaxID=450367 RepID=UPI00222782CB|nr:peptidase G2 autoproteolytic cleavage domain-containing protein [Peribacillus frigoritolerans]UYZ00678.1 hypothetical protein OJ967_09385 [Peribacillus frigoritolerans]